MATYKSGRHFTDAQRARLELLLTENKPLRIAVYNDLKNKSIRIFENGLNSAGGLIGHYSTKPMYMNPNFAPRKGDIRTADGGKLEGLLPTRGKPTKKNPDGERFFTASTAFFGVPGTKAGDPHRTTYLDGGYKELRNRTGRRIDKVDLRFTNDLFLDWANSARTSQPPTPTRINQHRYVIKLKRKYNAEKLEGLEKKYGKIFNSTTDELDKFFQTIEFNYNQFLKGIDVN